MPAKFAIGGMSVKDPRVVMRGIIGVLLAANLAAAVIAFKPFGGSADDLRRQQQALTNQLAQLQNQLTRSKQHVEKVQKARSEGDAFLDRYFSNTSSNGAMIVAELNRAAIEAGIKMGQATFDREPIEGSDTLQMLTTQVGFEGSYANLTKFINLLDKSPRFMIIENLQAAAPQQQAGALKQNEQALNVTLKIDTFVKGMPGDAS